MKRVLAAIALSVASMPALAVERPFIGVDLERIALEPDAGDTLEVNALRLRFGSMLTPTWGLQADIGIGGNQAEGTVPPTGAVEYRMQENYMLSGVGRLNLGKAGIYGYVGYAYVVNKIGPAAGASVAYDDDGLAYGAGIDIPFFWGNSLEIDGRMLHTSDEYNQMGISVGLRRYF